MRFVVIGTGAVGGVVGGRLFEHGQGVVFVARGAQYEAIRERGLRIDAPEASITLDVPVVDAPSRIDWRSDDTVLLCVKSQDTIDALDALVSVAPPDIGVVCVQNGVANESNALRRFASVYGVCVVLPSAHLEPGVVQAHAAPLTGLLDIGRFPRGADDRAETIAQAFRVSTFESLVRGDIMRWKYAKLLNNLGNAVDALCRNDPDGRALTERARTEGEACLAAAGIDAASPEEDAARRGNRFRWRGAAWSDLGASSWQSLARRTGSIETDYLNGEIVLLGRLHGVATPVNALLQMLAARAAREGWAPGSQSASEIIQMLPDGE
jgi:2-dehydropantoate 2-reductase